MPSLQHYGSSAGILKIPGRLRVSQKADRRASLRKRRLPCQTRIKYVNSLLRSTIEIRRTTNIEFNNGAQQWEVKDLKDQVRFSAKSRSVCLEWEQQNLQPEHAFRTDSSHCKGTSLLIRIS
jgi:hypothetical protein